MFRVPQDTGRPVTQSLPHGYNLPAGLVAMSLKWLPRSVSQKLVAGQVDGEVAKLIRYARVSTRQQDSDRQEVDHPLPQAPRSTTERRLVRIKKGKHLVEKDPEVASHLHDDDEITHERVNSFAEAPTRVQLLVLGQLRLRSEDQEASLLPAVEAMALAILALFLTITPDSMRFAFLAEPIADPVGRWISVTAGMVIFGLFAAALVLPVVWKSLKADRRRGRASAWLEAYDRELTRRRTLSGRQGRSWRRTHPI